MSALGTMKDFLDDSWDQTNGGLDVNVQSQTSPLFGYYMMTFDKDDITLVSAVAEDATTVTLSTGHGFTGVAGEHILIYENNHFAQQEVTAVQISGDIITLTTPVDIAFTTGATVVRGNINFNKDFSGANAKDIVFQVLDGTTPIDISRVIIMFQSSADPDEGSFGGISALTNGVYFRQLNTRRVNLGNYKKNIDFRARGASIDYSDKAPSTAYANTITVDIEESYGQVLRISPTFDCSFVAHLRDNFSSLVLFQIAIIGSYTQGEE